MAWWKRLPFVPTRGGAALALLGLGIFGAAQTTGAGWLIVLASLIVGTLLTGAVWPLALARTATVDVSGPIDAVAGSPFDFSVVIGRPRAGVSIEIPPFTTLPVSARPPGAGTIEVVARHRGVIRRLEVDVSCSAPFDLFSARRQITVELNAPIYVAPSPTPMALPDRLLGGASGEGAGAGGYGPGDMVRSLREYAPGDAMRMVHWRASAGRPELLVKELEPPERPHLALVVDVSGPDAEQVAREAAGLIQAASREGMTITLSTYESAGPVIGEVGSSREAGRRLAGAVSGRPPSGPLPDGSEVIRLGPPGRGSPS